MSLGSVLEDVMSVWFVFDVVIDHAERLVVMPATAGE